MNIKPVELQNPVIPIEFLSSVFCGGAADHVMKCLNDNEVPLEIRKLFNMVLWSNFYIRDFYKNNGQVSDDLNKEAQAWVMEGLQLLGDLGHDFHF